MFERRDDAVERGGDRLVDLPQRRLHLAGEAVRAQRARHRGQGVARGVGGPVEVGAVDGEGRVVQEARQLGAQLAHGEMAEQAADGFLGAHHRTIDRRLDDLARIGLDDVGQLAQEGACPVEVEVLDVGADVAQEGAELVEELDGPLAPELEGAAEAGERVEELRKPQAVDLLDGEHEVVPERGQRLGARRAELPDRRVDGGEVAADGGGGDGVEGGEQARHPPGGKGHLAEAESTRRTPSRRPVRLALGNGRRTSAASSASARGSRVLAWPSTRRTRSANTSAREPSDAPASPALDCTNCNACPSEVPKI